jgi:lipoprotein-releasing system permease protein
MRLNFLSVTILPRLVPGEFGVILGGELARSLGVMVGDAVTLIAPSRLRGVRIGNSTA